MKRRFILVDHSIEDSAGHYLEYARRVLRAARQEGFETILGVNRRAGEIVCPESDVIDKTFSRTFWENHAQSYFKSALHWFTNSSQISGRQSLSRQYARELREFFRRVGATSDDVVFVPTLGGTELIAVALYSRLREARDLRWHLLFRRDLPMPTSLFDAKARLDRARVGTALSESKIRFRTGSFAYYTDTEELTTRYNRLGVADFTTLPIPIDENLRVKKPKQALPYVVSYLGDARVEKGFHLLPDLIATLRSAGFDESRVKFRIQANLPICGSTSRSVRAKAELARYQRPGVEILEGPFDSDTYHQLISTSDVILIPYCPRSYAARSSGIFAEALAAGVPTVYPEGSWMEESQVEGGSLGFRKVADMPAVLASILSNYAELESKSIAYSCEWRNKHSARNLVRHLTNHVPT